MRISTAQLYNQSISSINKHQSSSNALMDQISSGKRVNTAGDDPVASIGIDNLSQQNTLIDQYLKNIDYATNHLALAESQLGDADTLTMSIRDNMLAALNGSYSESERQSLADEMQHGLDALLALANYRDGDGHYLFSGTLTEQQPFAFDNSGNIVYSGNDDTRQALVAAGVAIATNLPGDTAFMAAPNAMGDFSVNYSANQTGDFVVSAAEISDSAAYAAAPVGDYTISFTDDGAGGLNYQVSQGGAPLAAPAAFDPTNSIIFNGISMSFDGEPANGDSLTITEQANTNIFDTIQQAINLFTSGNDLQTPAGQSELAQLLNNFDSSVEQMRDARSVAGNALNSLDRITDNHQNLKLANSSALSTLEDLDFAEAISEFEKQQVALNASSQLFGRLSSFNLFDYI
ncbi:flagellar hook-associated protein FlgL [Shewanella avicenniae]|uniref:Flagellar hook-associated protein FlgL n=1 Tax=Shewanella avicenniae TaxID=2814294 RepID=A0ABX7QMR5_9GAMM|nr:flagellar hook-associated protein FlgL [Shewanella avicenniae]QSX32733.1 flagellar hook-associated protein FlgL [Shewanella avicenniae]